MASRKDPIPAEGYPGRLEYPIDKENQYNTKIVFQAVKVQPPSIASAGADNSSSSITGPPNVRNSGKPKLSLNNLKFFDVPGERADIYVPIGGFQVNDGFDYAQSTLGTAGAAAANTINRGGTVGKALADGASEFGQSLITAFNIATGQEGIGRVAALRAADKLLPSEQLRNAASIVTRVTMNPNIRSNFNGVAVREFTFNFKFIPCSPRESLAVKSIVKFFRFHSYPEEISSFGAFSVGLDYPEMFKIRLLSNSGNKHFKNIGTPIKLCYCKGVSTTYNPTSPVLHPDGSPTEIDMNLTFVEYKAQTRKDIEAEGSDSFYHFENGPTVDKATTSEPSYPDNAI